jgi:hypothetical protein
MAGAVVDVEGEEAVGQAGLGGDELDDRVAGHRRLPVVISSRTGTVETISERLLPPGNTSCRETHPVREAAQFPGIAVPRNAPQKVAHRLPDQHVVTHGVR